MFTLDGIKMVVFDFDDTLYAHPSHRSMSQEDLFKAVSKVGAAYYPVENFSSLMGEIMGECDKRNIMMALCSHISFAPVQYAKLEAVERAYGYKLLDLCVGDAKAKHLALRTVADMFNLKPCEIMLIDDLSLNLIDAGADGFIAVSPLHIYRCKERGLLFNKAD